MNNLKLNQEAYFNKMDNVLFNIFDESINEENKIKEPVSFKEKLIKIGVSKYSLELFDRVLKIEEKINEEYAIKYLEGYFEYVTSYNN